MAKAIFEKNNLVRGIADFPTGFSVKEAVHDGDTVSIVPDGHLSIRFLGIDTPEISLEYPELSGDPNSKKWLSTDKFEKYLTDPFSVNYPDSTSFKGALGSELVDYLGERLNDHTAKNHYDLAMTAQRKLEDIIQLEVHKRKEQNRAFRFFMVFANEVMDRYGRFLCYVDTDRDPSERDGELTYNEQMLQSGSAAPYFIWPNIDPFIGQQRPVNAIPDINNFQNNINKSKRLKNARNYVKKPENHTWDYLI